MATASTAVSDNPLESFQWTPQPKAEALVKRLAADFLARSAFTRSLKERLQNEAGVRLIDLIDHIQLPPAAANADEFRGAGYVPRAAAGAAQCFVQEQGLFPPIVVGADNITRLFLKVESVADFVSVWQISSDEKIEGVPLAPVRRARINASEGAELWVIERHGYAGFDVPEFSPQRAMLVLKHFEALRRRPRDVARESEGFAAASSLIDQAITDVGVDRTCDIFFAAEREYWQRRNTAARVQKARQDRLGIGWANHDHHTYRSSREHFAPMIAIFEKLGFAGRERFYAGLQAGWGAQIVEQPIARIIIFADVDMSPDELMGDFSHAGLAPRQQLGTVGLWCALHGEAFLQAGMHHLECQFDFDGLKQQLEASAGVKTMKPFTNFPYLRQAFTEGEIWPVRPQRIEKLLAAGQITQAQADQFRQHGALGSHLENLERNEGFKGFNQTGISEIIHRTDPRLQEVKR
ncbi:MAG TPA: hypothetical protein VH370_14965 [Humisphaera sp.]|nr:hypothetical protein [Humisphaera sp.]